MLTTLSLRITGEFLDPDEVTSILKVKPTSAFKKGDVKNISSKNPVISKFGIWTWKSESEITANEHILNLGNQFNQSFDKIKLIKNIENSWIDICIVSEGDDKSDSNFLIGVDALKVLSEIGLPLELTIY